MQNQPETIETKPTNPGVREIDLSRPFQGDWTLKGAESWQPVSAAKTVYDASPVTVMKAQTDIKNIFANPDLTGEAKRRKCDLILTEVENQFRNMKTHVSNTSTKGAEASESLAVIVRSPPVDPNLEERYREQRAVFSLLPESKRSALLTEALQRGNPSDVDFLRSLLSSPRGFETSMFPEVEQRAEEVVGRAIDPLTYSKATTYPIAAGLAFDSIDSSIRFLNQWIERDLDADLDKIEL